MIDGAVGSAGMILSLIFGGLGTIAVLLGAYRSKESLMMGGRVLLIGGFVGTLIAVGAIEHALITHDFALAYVVHNNSKETPLLYSITGMWSALQGSLLLWALIEGIYITVLIFAMRHERDRRTGSVALGILGLIYTYFAGLLVFSASPFLATIAPIPADGHGPDPLLQNYPLVAIHPPMLYLGFVGMSVPFALLAAALITRHLDTSWIVRVRNWSLVSWVALTIGITLGAWWSYQVLGWGGYWAWDPVENSALLPWLVATAFLHSAIVDRRRARMGLASFVLVSSMFSLTILATYFTRSGVLQSVHAFSDGPLGAALIAFFFVIVVFQIGVAIWRADDILGVATRTSLRSRTAALFFNNAIFGLITLIVLAGTVFPLLVNALSHQSVTVGAPFFDQFVIPLGLCLLVLMGVAPWLSWRSTSTKQLGDRLVLPVGVAVAVLAISVAFGVTQLATLGAYALGTLVIVSNLSIVFRSVRSQPSGSRLRTLGERSTAGMFVHVGVAVIAVGMASATTFGHQGSVVLRPGQTVHVFGQKLTYEGVDTVVTPAKSSFEANVIVNGSKTYHPAITQFGTYAQAVATPSVNVAITRDVYLTIDSPPTTAMGAITLGVVVQPLILWLWIGAGIMITAGLVAALGIREDRGSSPPSNGDEDDREKADVIGANA
ncbi:MAG: heme lyase CcmF/NrfE family subunit [Ferrimicrobium sp.]